MSTFEDLDGWLLEQAIDYRTGEMLDVRRYEVIPHAPDATAVIPTFTDITSVAGLRRFLTHIDRRTLVRVNDCRRLYDQDKGNHHLHGTAIQFPTSRYGRLDRLVERLDYANSIITTPGDLARYLRVRRNNIYRYLSDLAPLIQVRGPRDGMARGSLRIDVSPAYGYRFPGEWFGLARQDAIAHWYRYAMQ